MKILAITGPSGVGKGYFKESILERYRNYFTQPRIITTRPRRNTDSIDRLNVSE